VFQKNGEILLNNIELRTSNTQSILPTLLKYQRTL